MNLPAMQGNVGLILGLGRFPGEGNGNSCWETPWIEEPGML